MKRAVSVALNLSLLVAWAILLPAGIAAGEDAAPKPEGEKPAEGGVRNAILISWDGLDRPVLKELLAKEKLPNLAALIREGSLQEIEVRGHVTVTKPGHAEMLTGLDTKHTGVYTNQDYQPIPEGYTIFERVQKHLGGKDAIRTFMVTGKVAHVGGRGPEEIQGGKKGKKAAKKRAEVPAGADDDPEKEKKGEPFYLTRKGLDVFDAEQREASETGPLCLSYLEKHKEPRFLAFLHFSDPDHAGHKHGSASEEYRNAAVTCDEWLGKIVAWVKERGLYDRTPIYVTTDHGFDENAKSHSKAPHAWLATNDKTVTRGGTIADVPATILARFGVDAAKLDPPLLGKPLTGPADKPSAEGEKKTTDEPPDRAPRKGGRKGFRKANKDAGDGADKDSKPARDPAQKPTNEPAPDKAPAGE